MTSEEVAGPRLRAKCLSVRSVLRNDTLALITHVAPALCCAVTSKVDLMLMPNLSLLDLPQSSFCKRPSGLLKRPWTVDRRPSVLLLLLLLLWPPGSVGQTLHPYPLDFKGKGMLEGK